MFWVSNWLEILLYSEIKLFISCLILFKNCIASIPSVFILAILLFIEIVFSFILFKIFNSISFFLSVLSLSFLKFSIPLLSVDIFSANAIDSSIDFIILLYLIFSSSIALSKLIINSFSWLFIVFLVVSKTFCEVSLVRLFRLFFILSIFSKFPS